MLRLVILLVFALAIMTLAGYARQMRPQAREARLIETDEIAPVVDSLDCPPQRPTTPLFVWRYSIWAHDEAEFAQLATPSDSLECSYVFARPDPLPDIISCPEWSRENSVFDAYVDGLAFPGEYRFTCKVRDNAGNVSQEMGCSFEIVP